MSSRENLPSTSSTTAFQPSGSATSCTIKCARPPSSLASAAPSEFTSVSTTFAPSATKSRASAAPWPRAAPVTIATFPSRAFILKPLWLVCSPTPAGTLRPQEPITIGAAVVGIQIDVHARYQAVAKLEYAAESTARRFAAFPQGSVARLTAGSAFHKNRAARRYALKTRLVVDNRL